MITKAVIKEKVGNRFNVRIPLFETAGNPIEFILPATLCYEPGNMDGYKINDVVFVAFENGEAGKPVIIGKLYTGDDGEAWNHAYSSRLKVTTSAELPQNLKVGDVSAADVYATFKNNKLFEEKITKLDESIIALSKAIDVVNTKIDNLYNREIADPSDVERIYNGETVEDVIIDEDIATQESTAEVIDGAQVTDVISGDAIATQSDIIDIYNNDNQNSGE